jgi:hypothetical protein
MPSYVLRAHKTASAPSYCYRRNDSTIANLSALFLGLGIITQSLMMQDQVLV